MTTERFNVVLQGSTLGGQDAATVATELARLIKRDTEFALRLLRGQPTKLKSGVDAATGARYLEALERIGVAVRLEPETLEVDADLTAPSVIANQGQPCSPTKIEDARFAERDQAEGEFRGDAHWGPSAETVSNLELESNASKHSNKKMYFVAAGIAIIFVSFGLIVGGAIIAILAVTTALWSWFIPWTRR